MIFDSWGEWDEELGHEESRDHSSCAKYMRSSADKTTLQPLAGLNAVLLQVSHNDIQLKQHLPYRC